MIRDDIKARSIKALKARDGETRKMLANVLARFTEVEKSGKFEGWTEQGQLDVVMAHVKSLKKSISTMEGSDLAATYQKEIDLLADYLPKTLSEAEARPLLEPIAAKANGKLGPYMGMVMKQYKGKIDPGVIRKIGQELGLS